MMLLPDSRPMILVLSDASATCSPGIRHSAIMELAILSLSSYLSIGPTRLQAHYLLTEIGTAPTTTSTQYIGQSSKWMKWMVEMNPLMASLCYKTEASVLFAFFLLQHVLMWFGHEVLSVLISLNHQTVSTSAISFYIPISNSQRFQFCHNFFNICYFCS